MKLFGKIFYLAIWTTCSLYFGMAEIVNYDYYDRVSKIPPEKFQIKKDIIHNTDSIYTWDGHSFATQGDKEKAQLQSDIGPLYQWLFEGSELYLLILSCSFFGSFGAILRILNEKLVLKIPIHNQRLLLLPVLGLFNGVVIIAISYAIPSYLTMEGKINLKPVSVVILALLAGFAAEAFLDWLQNIGKKLFKTNA